MSDKYETVEVGETLTVEFDFSKQLEKAWRREWQYEVGDFISIGAYVYECTNAGKSGVELPESITKTIAATQTDGTVEWTCRDWSTDGSDTISTKTVTATTGLTVDSSSIYRDHYVRVTFTAGALGRCTLTCQVDTASGETLIGAQTILVK